MKGTGLLNTGSTTGLRSYLKLLTPGLHIKRWIALGFLGIVAFSVGVLYFVIGLLEVPAPQLISPYAYAGLLATGGAAVIGIAAFRFLRSVLPMLRQKSEDDSYATTIYQYRHRQRGPRIVVIGGGTGLSTMLRGLKNETQNITAIVTVADDGGSSGTLRRELGVLPPGDFRNCLVALADAEPLMKDLLQYRFEEGSGLAGHSFGNLLIVALSELTGSFEQAVDVSSRILAVQGRVVPSTLTSVGLIAEMENDQIVRGESTISGNGNRIRKISIDPPDAVAYAPAIEAIRQADLIVLGPGSLYTSVLPNLLVGGIRDAIVAASAPTVYVCNVATQPGETDGYDAGEHVRTLQRHVGDDIVQYMMVNQRVDSHFPDEWPNRVVGLEGLPVKGVTTVMADVVNPKYPLRHDPEKLSQALIDGLENGTLKSRQTLSRGVA